VIAFSPNGSTQTIPANGGYWDQGFDFGIGRNNPVMDDMWANDYSKTTVCNGTLVDDTHFALYYNGQLLREWTGTGTQDAQSGAEPCCGSSSSAIGQVASAMFVRPVSPTPAMGNFAVVAAPNVSRNGEPIQFRIALPKAARVSLSIFALSGELVYQTEVYGSRGTNTLIWEARNQARQAVASGLYLYVLRANDGSSTQTVQGKIAIIR
jgi:hypothetical protein